MFTIYELSEYKGQKGRSGRRRGIISSNGWTKDKLTTGDKVKLGLSTALLAGSIGAGVYYGHKLLKTKAPKPKPTTPVHFPRVPSKQENAKAIVDKVYKNSELSDINQVKKNLNDPNYEWKFTSDITTIAEFEKAPKKMTKAGAWARIGTVGTVGAGLGAGASKLVTKAMGMNRRTSNIAALTGGALTGLMAGGSSYAEHRSNKHSPIGKKKWKNYNTNRPSIYGIPVQKVVLIKGLK